MNLVKIKSYHSINPNYDGYDDDDDDGGGGGDDDNNGNNNNNKQDSLNI